MENDTSPFFGVCTMIVNNPSTVQLSAGKTAFFVWRRILVYFTA